MVAPGAVLDRESTAQIDIQVTAYDSPLDASVRRYTNVRVSWYLLNVLLHHKFTDSTQFVST